MADREKVIEGLEKLRKDLGYGLPDRSNVVMEYLNSLTDAITMLKDQEPKTILGFADTIEGVVIGNCSRCHRLIVGKENDPVWFCKYCGQAVKWE